MQEHSDLVFQAIFKQAWYGLLNLEDINTLNSQIAFYLSDFNFTNTIIIIQKNKTRYLIIIWWLKILLVLKTKTSFFSLLSILGINKIKVILFNIKTFLVYKKVKKTL